MWMVCGWCVDLGLRASRCNVAGGEIGLNGGSDDFFLQPLSNGWGIQSGWYNVAVILALGRLSVPGPGRDTINLVRLTS